MAEVGVCMGSDTKQDPPKTQDNNDGSGHLYGNRIHLKPKTTMTEVGVCMGSDTKQDPPKTQDNNDGSGCLYGK